MKKDYDLNLIEYKVRKKYKESMEHLDGLRAALDRSDEKTQKLFEEWLAADLCCSIQAEACLNDPDDVPRYKYTDGTCKFYVDGVKFIVADLCDMRCSKAFDKPCGFDICCVLCSYKDDGIYHWNFVPDAWSYGSTTDDFEEYHEVCDIFLDKCSQFIKEHGGAEYLREMQKDEEE